MKTTQRTDAVSFSVKGRVVIPRWLRKEYEIEEGTRAIVTATDEGILLKPVTRRTIARLYGVLKRKPFGEALGKPGDKPFAEWWADHKREEKALEEAKHARHSSR